jgi:hypothetical protein
MLNLSNFFFLLSKVAEWNFRVEKFTQKEKKGFNLHLYRLMMIDYYGVAPLVELCCDRRVLVWIDYSAMELTRQCLD